MVFASSAVVSALDVPAAVLDVTGRLVAGNGAWHRDGTLPRHPGEALGPALRPDQVELAAAAVADAGRGRSTQLTCQLADGRAALLRAAPLADREGSPYALVTLRPAPPSAPPVTAAALAALGHRMRAPTSGIAAMIDALLAHPLDHGVRDMIEAARRSAAVLETTMAELIELAARARITEEAPTGATQPSTQPHGVPQPHRTTPPSAQPQPQPQPQPEPPAGGQATGPAAVAQLPGGRVLLAEDDEINRGLLGRMLTVLGLRWDPAENGAAAIEATLARHYDVILMDARMPGIDGMEATRRIRAAEQGDRHTPIIALTANTLDDDRAAYLAAGMDGYLAKPVRLDTLRVALTPYLAQPASGAGSAPGAGRGAGDAVDLDVGQLAHLAVQVRDTAHVAATLRMFVQDLPVRCLAIADAAERLDQVGLEDTAHAMKSTCVMLGAATLADLCRRLELEAKDGDWAQLHRLVAAVQPAADRVTAAARRYLAKDPARV